MSFSTQFSLAGPLRQPKQMLAEQSYSDDTSIHDDQIAASLGFQAGPIEGPTHFSQLSPHLLEVFGPTFFERGCLSVHYKNMVVEGESVRAFCDTPGANSEPINLWMEKADGTPVLEGNASIGPEYGETFLSNRIKELRPPKQLVILSDLKIGMQGVRDELVCMKPDQKMGSLYPFSLNEKLAAITERSEWYEEKSPWGAPIIPLEMISVLVEYSSRDAKFPIKGPAIGLFADQEIKLIDGPIFVGKDYVLRREIIALSESRRTESYWVRTKIFDPISQRLVGETILNHATLKDSYSEYDADLKKLSAGV